MKLFVIIVFCYERAGLVAVTTTYSGVNIRKTCPCNVYPIEHHFYKAKLGYAGLYLFFLFLLRGGSNVYPQSMF